MRSNRLQVAVLSRHPLVQVGLSRLLSADATGGAVGIHAVDQDGHPSGHDVAIYDLDGLDAASVDLDQLVASGIPVVALEPDARPDLGDAALAAGAAAVIPMSITAAELLDVLTRAVAGQRMPSDGRREQIRATAAQRFGLSQRELEILELIGAGLSNDDIAGRLYLSLNSIKSYIRAGYKKIGVTTRSQAVLWVVRHHLGPVRQAG